MVRQGLWIPSLTGHLERSYLLTFWLRRFNSVSPTVDHEPLIMTLHRCLTFSSVPACHPAWSCQMSRSFVPGALHGWFGDRLSPSRTHIRVGTLGYHKVSLINEHSSLDLTGRTGRVRELKYPRYTPLPFHNLLKLPFLH